MKTPYISPLYGDFTDFPPVLIHVGSDEVLLDDSRELAIRMEAQGVTVDIDIYAGMWHVWHMFDVEEARAAIRKIQWFVHAQLEVGGLKKRVIRRGPSTVTLKARNTGCCTSPGTARPWRKWSSISSCTAKWAYGCGRWRCF